MLYQAIRKACEKYHPINGWDYDCALKAYREALKKRHESADSDNPSYEEAAILLSFANGWSSRMQRKADDVQRALKEIQPNLDTLKDETLLDVCLDKEKRKLICRSFKTLAYCNAKRRNESTGASKMLHIINPKLFVMWDGAIRSAYICKLKEDKLEKNKWIWYTEFLQEMQQLAQCAVEQVTKECGVPRNEVVKSFVDAEHSLAKALDEYNYMKYTRECGSVWQAEYESCSSP